MSEARHIVTSYAQELQHLRDLLTRMGGLVENQLMNAMEAITENDEGLAERTRAGDKAVDALEREAEQFVIRMLALRQPMAVDLRQIVASLKITAALERIGDYAKNIAKRTAVLHQFALPFSLTGLSAMGRLTQENLRLVVDAIGDNDAVKAVQVWEGDQAIDDLYNSIFRELVTYMMEDGRNITPCTHLLFIAKNLERIGDHATNIAETVHYAVTGEALADERPKGGDGSRYVAAPEAATRDASTMPGQA